MRKIIIKDIVNIFPEKYHRNVYEFVKYLLNINHYIKSVGYEIHKNPIFVLGNQKSGTSVITGLLAEMSGKSVALDLKNINRNYQKYIELFNDELSFNEFLKYNKLYFSKDIIKEPHLMIFYDKIVNEFPDSKYVFVVRDPRDNIRSILDRLDIPGNLDILTTAYKNQIAYSYNLLFDLSWINQNITNYIEMLIWRWNYFVDVYSINRDKIIFIKYEDFKKNKKEQIELLTHKLNLSCENDIESKLNINFQPSGKKKNMRWIDFFGEKNLRKIENLCAPNMRLFNYNSFLSDNK